MWLIQSNQLDNGIVSLKRMEYYDALNRICNGKLLSKTPQLKIIHYPDCQQIILWLPLDYKFFESILVQRLDEENIWMDVSIEDVIQGRIQIILDTHPWPCGDYSIQIHAKDGTSFILFLEKVPIDIYKGAEQLPLDPNQSSIYTQKFKVYKDGQGNDIIQEDAIIREKAYQSIQRQFSRRLEFKSYGRYGEVTYIDGVYRLNLGMEMGGFNCMFYLNVPDSSNWEKHTGIPLSERQSILEFVAEETKRTQCSNCYYEIRSNDIAYYRKQSEKK